MGWNFRRSIKLGPVRLNLSKSGIGTSMGGPFGSVSRSPTGRVTRTFRIPGTGISYRTGTREGAGGGCLPLVVLVMATIALTGLAVAGALAGLTPAVAG
jgi:hypothetical protein